MKDFCVKLSSLRREKKLSQRQAALDLGVSQGLLSHYENGAREPKLEFVVKACDYYGVTADYILGRSDVRNDRVPALIGALGDAAKGLEGLKSAGDSLLNKLKKQLLPTNEGN